MQFTIVALLAACVYTALPDPVSGRYKATNLRASNQLKNSFLLTADSQARLSNYQKVLQGTPIPTPAQASARSSGHGHPIPIRSQVRSLFSGRRRRRRMYISGRRPLAAVRQCQTSSYSSSGTGRSYVCSSAKQCQSRDIFNDLDVLFVLDHSGSVGSCNFQKELEFVDALSCQLNTSQARVGVISFGSTSSLDVPLCRPESNCALARRVRRLPYRNGATATACALNHANAVFDEADQAYRQCLLQASSRRTTTSPPQPASMQGSGFDLSGSGSVEEENETDSRLSPESTIPLDMLPPARRVFVITDGRSNTGGSPRIPALKLQERGVEVFVLGVTRSINVDELRSIASPNRCESVCALNLNPSWTSNSSCPDGCEKNYVYLLEEFSDFSELAQLFSNDPELQQNCRQCPRPANTALDAVFSQWSDWSECRYPRLPCTTDPIAVWHSRTRQCKRRSTCGGHCVGPSMETQKCFEGVLPCEKFLCENGQSRVPDCSQNRCTDSTCPAFPKAKCFFDDCRCRSAYKLNGMEVDCNTPKRRCDSIQCPRGSVCSEMPERTSPQCCFHTQHRQKVALKKLGQAVSSLFTPWSPSEKLCFKSFPRL